MSNTYILREHLVDMSVHRYTLPVGCRLEAVPVAVKFESVNSKFGAA